MVIVNGALLVICVTARQVMRDVIAMVTDFHMLL